MYICFLYMLQIDMYEYVASIKLPRKTDSSRKQLNTC